MIEEFVKDILTHFDWAYMIVVNVFTYLLIKGVDWANGDKALSKWQKWALSIVSGLIIGISVYYMGGDKVTLFYSFFVSLFSWDWVFSPIIKKIGFGYKNTDKK